MLDFTIRLALAPVLLAQGIRVRARALRLPEASGDRLGKVGNGPPLSLLILGDSSAAGVGVTHQSQALSGRLTTLLARHYTLDWQVHARTGATTQSTLDRLKEIAPAKFDIIVTALGVNDVTHAVPRPLWIRRQQRLFAELDSLFEPRLIYASGVPPLGGFPVLPQPLRWSLGRQAARFDAHLANILATVQHVRHVPFNMPLDPGQMAADGFHPGPHIYDLWAKEMASRITSDWPKVN